MFTNGQHAYNLMFSWARSEPNNSGNQDCACFDKNRNGLDDYYCNDSGRIHRVLCQIPNGFC